VISFSVTPKDIETHLELVYDHASLENDGVDYTGIEVLKPWGSEMQVRCTPFYAVTCLHMKPDGETSMHCHTTKTVLLIVERGAVVFEGLEQSRHLGAGEVAMIERAVFHRLRAMSYGAEVIEIEMPSNKNDLVRLADKHGRAGKAYAAG
jgi:mannose-6-phosphate isomerase-like protein (cupin superfamily)